MYRSTMKSLASALGALLLALGLAAPAQADIDPRVRQHVATYQQGLSALSNHGGLSEILGQSAFGEGGQLVSGSELRARSRSQAMAGRGPVDILGIGAAGTDGASAGAGPGGRRAGPPEPPARPVPESGPEGTPEPKPGLKAKLRNHAVGFGQFSLVLASYVGAQLLVEIDKGNMKREDFFPELQKLIVSPEAVAGYLSFVGLHETGELIISKGAQWGSKVPAARSLWSVAEKVATKNSLRRVLLKQGILLTAISATLEVGHHWWKRMKLRPWEEGNADAAAMARMSTVGSFLHAMRQRGNFVNTVGHAFQGFVDAVGDVDWVGVVVSSAAFIAGMAITAWAPGWVQLAVGLILSDLAHRYLVPWIHRQISSRISRASAAGRLRQAYLAAVGGYYGNRQDTPGAITSYELDRRRRTVTDAVTKAEKELPEAFDAELNPIEEEYEQKYQQLAWAARGKLTSDLTNQMTHAAGIFRRADWAQMLKLPDVVGDAARQAYAAAQAYAGRAEEQTGSIIRVFSGGGENLQPMRTLWSKYARDLKAADEESLWNVTPQYADAMHKELVSNTANSNIRAEGGARILNLALQRTLMLELARRKIESDEGKLDNYTREAQRTAYRAARTRAEEIRQRLAQMDLRRLVREASPHVRKATPSYGGYYGGGGIQSDPLSGHLSTIRGFLGDRSDRLEQRERDVNRRQSSVDRATESQKATASAALQRIEDGLRKGERFETYAFLLASLTARGHVPRDHKLLRHALRGISSLRDQHPDKRRELYTKYNALITAIAARHRSLVPTEWLREMRELGVSPQLPRPVTPEPDPRMAGLGLRNQFPWPTGGEPANESQWALQTLAGMESMDRLTNYQGLEEQRNQLDAYRQQNEGFLGAGGSRNLRGENVARAHAKEAAGLIQELRAAEKVMDDLGYLERRGTRGLDRPLWIVPHFDQNVGKHEELTTRANAQQARVDELEQEYWDLFDETMRVLEAVYRQNPQAFPTPQAITSAGTSGLGSSMSDEDMARLMEYLRDKGGAGSGGASAAPGGPFGIPAGNSTPVAQPATDPAPQGTPAWFVENDHMAYQPLLTYLVSLEPDQVLFFLRQKEEELTPKRTPEDVYRPFVPRFDPDAIRARMPRTIDTRICHGGNRQACEPDLSSFSDYFNRDPNRFAEQARKEELERLQKAREDQEDAWRRNPPRALADARTRYEKFRQILRGLDSLEAAWDRNAQELEPLHAQLYPEQVQGRGPVPATIR